MKLKNHISNSNKNEDPLRNEKSLKDKALMTGQQKVEKKYVLYKHTPRSIKRRRKKEHSCEKQVPATPNRTKSFKKHCIYEKTTFMDKTKMPRQTNDWSQPFQERKRHKGKEKNH